MLCLETYLQVLEELDQFFLIIYSAPWLFSFFFPSHFLPSSIEIICCGRGNVTVGRPPWRSSEKGNIT